MRETLPGNQVSRFAIFHGFATLFHPVFPPCLRIANQPGPICKRRLKLPQPPKAFIVHFRRRGAIFIGAAPLFAKISAFFENRHAGIVVRNSMAGGAGDHDSEPLRLPIEK